MFNSQDNSKELLSDKVLYLMYLVLHNYDLDLPKIVMEYMYYAASQKKRYTLPYANLLSLFFKYFSIPIKEEEETIREGFGLITEKTLQNIGIVQTKGGAWKLLGKLTDEELKEKDFTKIKTLKPDKVSRSYDQKFETFENDLEELKEGMLGIQSEMQMMKYHIESIDKTLSNIIVQIQLHSSQEEALNKAKEEALYRAQSMRDEDCDDFRTPYASSQPSKKGSQHLGSEDIFEEEVEDDDKDEAETGKGEDKEEQKDDKEELD